MWLGVSENVDKGGCRIIYPDTYPQFAASGNTHKELMEILTAVNLAYLPAREGGWTTRKEWRDVLSGGEKQRVSALRLCLVRSLTVGADGHGQGVLPQTEVRYPGWYDPERDQLV